MLLQRIGLASLFLLPMALLSSRSLADALVSVIALAFVARCVRAKDWAWLRRPWLWLPLALWAWVVLCSVIGIGGRHSAVEAVAALRYWVFVAALEGWLLREAWARRWLWRIVAASALWIAAQCWLQYLAGVNTFGVPRWGDGSLTGPFDGPRAGPALVIVLLPALLPPAMRLIGRGGWWRLPGGALPVAGIATLVLIGQRMPALLGVLQLLVAGLLLQRFRPALLAAVGLGAALLAALPLVSPPTEQKLVVHFLDQLAHFPATDYGQIYLRAATMIAGNPVFGLGFDGFRDGCGDPRWAAHPLVAVPPATTGTGCNIHPHSFWLEAGVMGGLPGFFLFAAVAVAWLARSFGGLRQDPLRVALFATLVGRFWPLASTTGFYNEPTAGWMLLVASWALALRPAAADGGIRAAA
jgi:hypothetical protein